MHANRLNYTLNVTFSMYSNRAHLLLLVCSCLSKVLDFVLNNASLSPVRFLCQRSIPVESTLLWSSAWNTTPVMVITQAGSQVREFTLQAGLVYLFLSVSPCFYVQSHKWALIHNVWLLKWVITYTHTH